MPKFNLQLINDLCRFVFFTDLIKFLEFDI